MHRPFGKALGQKIDKLAHKSNELDSDTPFQLLPDHHQDNSNDDVIGLESDN